MTKRFFLFAFILAGALSVNAQTADEILAKYFENTGGLEKWISLKSSKMAGMMAMQGMEFPGTVYAALPNKQRVEVNVMGKAIVQAYDGETAWWINPFMGGEDPQKMPDEMAEEMTRQEFQSDFINYKEKGHAVELEGTEEVEGAEAFKIKLTKKSGDVEYHYFDSEYYVPIMMKTTVKSGPAQGQMAETYMSDYQEVDGMMFPFFIESKVNGQSFQKITIDTISVNEEYEDVFFAFPAAPAEKKE
jgi:outer membrane lipoprotein-sorting protein